MIVISNDKMTLEFFEDGDKKTFELNHEIDGMTKYMDHMVHIEKGVTVKDLFTHLAKEQELIDTIFDCSLGGHSFSDFVLESLGEPDPNELLHYAVFEHLCNMESDELLHEIRFNIFGEHPTDDIIVEYCVELSPINSYLHLEVHIDTLFSITRVEEVDGQEIDMVLFEADKPITLYELISALLFEISYYGTSDTRAEILDKYTAEILSSIEEESNKDSTEDINILEAKLKSSISNEDYETSAQIRDKINDIRKRSNKIKPQDGRKEQE